MSKKWRLRRSIGMRNAFVLASPTLQGNLLRLGALDPSSAIARCEATSVVLRAVYAGTIGSFELHIRYFCRSHDQTKRQLRRREELTCYVELMSFGFFRFSAFCRNDDG
jgi:hypothetical protein